MYNREISNSVYKEFEMSENKITKDMSIIEIVQKYPQSIEVFAKYGLGCVGCAAARFENLEAGARVHSIDPEALVNEINAAINK